MVDGVGKHSHAKRVVFVRVCNVQPVDHKLWLVAAGMNHRRNCLKPFHAGQRDFLCIIQMVLNVILAVAQPVHLDVSIFCVIDLPSGCERALANNTVIPRQRVDVPGADVVDANAARINNFCCIWVNSHAFHHRHIRNGSYCRFALLRFVSLDLPIVIGKNSIDKFLFLFAFKRDVDSLVH